jgi:hypothetical protein
VIFKAFSSLKSACHAAHVDGLCSCLIKIPHESPPSRAVTYTERSTMIQHLEFHLEMPCSGFESDDSTWALRHPMVVLS